MSAIYLLIPISLLVALGFLAAFLWAVRSGQYEDTLTPALRVLTDEPPGGEAGSRAAAPQDQTMTHDTRRDIQVRQ
jgi:cbb3-type cytochrome oxidase maturation protein